MKILVSIYLVSTALLLCWPFKLYCGQDNSGEPLQVPVKLLYAEPEVYNGRKVQVQGEAIGDIISDGNMFWVNIRDGNAFIGVFINEKDRVKIKNLGRYGVEGDLLRVTGTYNFKCAKHLGGNDIHGENIEVIQAGLVLEEDIDSRKVVISFLLGIAAILFLFLAHRKSSPQGSGEKLSLF